MNKYTMLELLELLAERTKLPQDSILEALFNQAVLTGGAYAFATVILIPIVIHLFFLSKEVSRLQNTKALLLIVGLIVSAVATFCFFQALSIYINTPYWIMKEMLDLLDK